MIDLVPNEKKIEEHRYQLKAKVIVKDVTYTDEQSTGTSQVTDKLVFLIPEDSTQRDLFYTAWLPDDPDSPQEVVCQAGHPVYSTFRAALWRRTQHVGDIHLFVMSKGTEEVLKTMNGLSLVFEVLGQQEDNLADNQRDWKLPYNKNI